MTLTEIDWSKRPRNGVVFEDGVKVWDSSWPRCHFCGRRAGDLAMLHYRRADGVPGCSHLDCGDCRRSNAERLERLGFTMIDGDPRVITDG